MEDKEARDIANALREILQKMDTLVFQLLIFLKIIINWMRLNIR